MKVQDLLFLVLLLSLIYLKDPKYFVFAGLILLALSIPFFHFWVFFTAQRLVSYVFFLFLISSILFIVKKS